MKKIIFPLSVLFLIFVPLTVYSQNWTPEEKTILEKVKTENRMQDGRRSENNSRKE